MPGPLPFFRFIIRDVDENSEACVITGVDVRFVGAFGAFGRNADGIEYFEAVIDLRAGRKVEMFMVGSIQVLLWSNRDVSVV